MTPEQENGHRLLVSACDVAARGRQTLKPSMMAEVRDQLKQLKSDRDRFAAVLWSIGHAGGIETKADLMKAARAAIKEPSE